MKWFNLAKDGVPEILINRNIDELKAGEIAEELFNTMAEKVRFRINSFGGNVKAGFEILSAMQAFQAAGNIIETINMGVADSVASWLLSAGTKGHRFAFEHSRSMIHPPELTNGQTIDQLPEGDMKDQMNEIFDSLILILSRTTGMAKNTLRALMKKETRFKGRELVTNGFVDKLIKIKNEITIPENANTEEIIEIVNNSNLDINIKKEGTMLNELLNLNSEASDSAKAEAVRKIQNQNKELTDANEGLTTQVGEKDTEIANLKEEVANLKTAQNEAKVDAWVKEGKIEKGKKEEIQNQIKELGFEAVEKIISMTSSNKKSPDLGLNESKKEGDGKASDSMKNALTYAQNGMKDEALKADYIKHCDSPEFHELLTKKEEE